MSTGDNKNKNLHIRELLLKNKVYELTPIRQRGVSGLFEYYFFNRLLFVDSQLNVYTSLHREPLKWTYKNGRYEIHVNVWTNEGKKECYITLKRLLLWLYGDKDGNTLELINKEPRKRCIPYGTDKNIFNPKALRISKTLTKQYIKI